MIGNFDLCCAFSLHAEGGYCNIQGDPGGATNHGITIGELSAVMGKPATIQDVQNLTSTQAEAIYKPRYWDAVNGNGLPKGIDQITFDFGITAGPENSAKLLQSVLGITQDGDIGPVTLAAIAKQTIPDLITWISAAHSVYYRSLPGFAQFGAGWLARVNACQQAAQEMVEQSG